MFLKCLRIPNLRDNNQISTHFAIIVYGYGIHYAHLFLTKKIIYKYSFYKYSKTKIYFLINNNSLLIINMI